MTHLQLLIPSIRTKTKFIIFTKSSQYNPFRLNQTELDGSEHEGQCLATEVPMLTGEKFSRYYKQKGGLSRNVAKKQESKSVC